MNTNLINITKDFVSPVKTEKIKVGVLVREPYVTKRILSINSNNIASYDGIAIEIFDEIKKLANDSWIIDYEFIEEPNNDEEIQNLANGKYDMLIGGITIDQERIQKVKFTKTLFLGKYVLLFKTTDNVYSIFLKGLYKNLAYPLLLMAILSIIFGVILNYFDKSRGGLRNTMWSAVVGLFGEPGPLAENTNEKPLGMAVALVIMMVSFYFAIFLQAYTAGEVIDDVQTIDPFLTKDDLYGKNILMRKSFAPKEYLKSIGTDVTIYAGKENIVKFYNKNLDKYDGVGIDLQQGLYATTRFDNIHMSQMNLGFAELAFAVNPNRRQLLEKINKAIYNLEENNVILSKCDKYFKEYNYLCKL